MVISEKFPDNQSDLEKSINTRREYTNFRTYPVCKINQNSQPDARQSRFKLYALIGNFSELKTLYDDQETSAENRQEIAQIAKGIEAFGAVDVVEKNWCSVVVERKKEDPVALVDLLLFQLFTFSDISDMWQWSLDLFFKKLQL